MVFTRQEEIRVGSPILGGDIPFNEGWKFYMGESESAKRSDFNDASWQSLSLPHDFSIEQEFTVEGEAQSGFLPGGTGWYRKTFLMPEACKDKTILLSFDGVYKDSYVYVNGILVGENHYGYMPFSFDITAFLVCDGVTENTVAVRVEHTIPSSRWYSGSGIYREVALLVVPPVHIALNGIRISTPRLAREYGNGTATVSCEVEIENLLEEGREVIVRNQIYNADGIPVSETVETGQRLETGTRSCLIASAKVSHPLLWSLEDPVMYCVRTELLVSNQVIEQRETKFGFRWFAFDEQEGFRLNGRNVKLCGVCMHHDQGALGAAACYDAVYRQLSLMKEMGANAVRTAHNPADKHFLQICDELGLLVIEELFDGWNVSKNGNSHDFAAYFNERLTEKQGLIGGSRAMTWAEFAVKSTVRRDRNHPSLMLWSLGNEIQEGAAVSKEFPNIAKKLIAWIREEDKERKVTHGDNTRAGNEVLREVLEVIRNSGGIVGFNYAAASELDALTRVYGCLISSETASAVNSRGVYTTEQSRANADGKYHLTSYDSSTVAWGKTASASIYDTMTRDFVAGEFVWTGFDYIGEPTPWNGIDRGSKTDGRALPNSSYFGIVETTGFPKDSYYLYRSQWNRKDTTLHLVTAWDEKNMRKEEGKTPVAIYTNGARVELYRNEEHIGTATRRVHRTKAGHCYFTYEMETRDMVNCTPVRGSEGKSLYAKFMVAYEKGRIWAKAYDEQGKEIKKTVGKAMVYTPEAAVKLRVARDRECIAADGKSLVYLTYDVVDDRGVIHTTANHIIRITLEGNAQIAGVDNGDQATLAKYQQPAVLSEDKKTAEIAAYAGKALVILRSTEASGKVRVTAQSDGLESAVTTVQIMEARNKKAGELISYRMPRHCYVPLGAARVELPENIEVTLRNGKKENCPVSWSPFDRERLKQRGNFQVTGRLTLASEALNLSITIHVYSEIAGGKNYSGMTRPGVIPVLPAQVMTYLSDGSAFEEAKAVWHMENMNAASFAHAGDMVEIEGEALPMDGKAYPIRAFIRVAAPIYGEEINIMDQLLRLEKREEKRKKLLITLTWATVHWIDSVNLYLDSSISFSYTLDGVEWKETEYRKTELGKNRYAFIFKERIEAIAICLRLEQEAFEVIEASGIEVMSRRVSYE